MKVPQKIKNRTMIRPSNFTYGSMRKSQTLIQKDICASVFIATLLTRAQLWKQPKCPPIDNWIKKMWGIYTGECYSVIKRNEILTFATT